MKIQFNRSYISLLEFEKILKGNFDRSLNVRSKEIIFDVSKIEYMDLPQLCLLYMWIGKILGKGSRVILNFSIDDNKYAYTIYHLCISYGLFSNLSCFGTLLEVRPSPKVISSGFVIDDPIVHLSSYSSVDAFNTFLSSLNSDYTSYDLTASQRYKTLMAKLGIRDVLLRELGLNVIMHSEGASAVIAVCSKSRKYLNYSSTPIPIKNYANRYGADDYIQVVVADFGAGIVGKLKQVFMNDLPANEVLSGSNDESVIEYAFWKETTSRPTRTIDEMFDENEIGEEFVPPTGLHFVKNLLIRRKGFMYVRSSESLYAIDCSTGIDKKITLKEWGAKLTLDNFQVIPGNLIVLYIPSKEVETTVQLQLLDKGDTANKQRTFRYIYAAECLIHAKDMKSGAVELLKMIRAETRKLKPNQTLLVDFQYASLDKKYLYKIIVYCMYLQEADKRIKLVDVASSTELELLNDEVLSITTRLDHLQPVLSYNTSGSEYNIIGDKQFNITRPLPSLNDYITEQRHISLEKELVHYYRRAKVLLPSPSKVYIEGYYELSDFINKQANHQKLIKHIINKLVSYEISIIIMTSIVLEKVAKEIGARYGLNNDNVILYKDNIPPILAGLKAKEYANKHVLVISDVIVTGKTLEKIANAIQHKTIVYAIVDGRPSKKLSLPSIASIESLKRHVFKISQVKPADWRYEDIQLIDPVSHKLIMVARNSYEALLDSDLSLEDLVVKNNIIRCGHYCYAQTCYTYFFNTLVLQQVYNDEFIEIIRKDIDEVCTRKLVESPNIEMSDEIIYDVSKVTNICYPQNNTPAEAICCDLQSYTGGAVTFLPRITTERGSIYSTASFAPNAKADVAVFVDTAATTSNTIKHAMDWASDIKAELLLIYIIINRMPADTASFIEGISRYKGVDVKLKSLFKEYLPAYTTFECPICSRTRRLESLSKQLMLNKCNRLFQGIIMDNERIPIKDARNEQSHPSNDDLKILHSQVYFRSKLENVAVAPTVLGSNSILDFVINARSKQIIKYAVIRALEREIEVFVAEKKYATVFDSEFKNTIFNLAIDISIDNDTEDDLRASAMWVASTIDHDGFINRLCYSGKLTLQSKSIKHLVAIIMLNYEKTPIEKNCNLLESIIADCGDFAEEIISDALREAEFYFRFVPSLRSSNIGRYIDAIDILSNIFEEIGFSHPRMRTKFDDVVRIVVPENLESAVGIAYLGGDGFFNMLNDKILPAMQRVLSAWPREYYLNSRYLQDQFRSDITDLDIILRRAHIEYKNNAISSDKWQEYTHTIDEISKRLYDNFFDNDYSELKKLLKESNTHTTKIINKVISKYFHSCELKYINTQIDVIDEQIKIPSIVIEDIISSVFNNAIIYSDNGSTVSINTANSTIDYSICIHSINSAGRYPELKEGHGLSNCNNLLKKYDGNIQLQSNNHINTVRILLPK